MLTESQKVDVRRHAGFAVFGNNITSSPPGFGYRWYSQYLTLEYRLNNLATEEETVLINVYVNQCNTLEAAIPTASDNLDTDRAAVWYHNKNEVRDRTALYVLWCRRLMDFLDCDGPAKVMNNLVVVV